MDIGILGTGMVGQALGRKLVQGGHRVCLGSRTADNPTAAAWARGRGPNATHGTFAEAARFGHLLFNCTAGVASLEALRRAGEENLRGKVLIDVANPLDFSHGLPPTLAFCNTDSLGEQIQRAHPEVRVVKALNTMNCEVMVDPARVPGEHHVFLSGNDAGAKRTVATLLSDAFGWPPQRILDLGDISTARGPEMLLPLWVRLWSALGTPDINFQVAGVSVRTAAAIPQPISTPVSGG